ncbi:MAG: hypothetical protein U1E60_00540 [Reyranellaceae bacterium]
MALIGPVTELESAQDARGREEMSTTVMTGNSVECTAIKSK